MGDQSVVPMRSQVWLEKGIKGILQEHQEGGGRELFLERNCFTVEPPRLPFLAGWDQCLASSKLL